MVLPAYYGVLSQRVATTLTNDLVAYYSLDVDASDSSGNSNDGTISGATLVTGKINDCRDFDGVNDYITVPHSNGLQATNGLTISMWVNIDDLTPNNNLIDKRNAGTWTQGYNLYIQDGIDNNVLVFNIPGVSSTGWGTTSITSGWHHIVAIYDSVNNKLQTYVNGNIDLDETTTGTPSVGTNDLIIGSRADVPESTVNGLVDEVVIWNRALTSAEVTELYNGGAGNNFLN